MANEKRKKKADDYVDKILLALNEYQAQHPQAKCDAYRRNFASIRVRVIDPDFSGMDRVERDSLIWTFLGSLPEKIQSEISMLVLVTPDETTRSLANLEFEDSSRSLL